MAKDKTKDRDPFGSRYQQQDQQTDKKSKTDKTDMSTKTEQTAEKEEKEKTSVKDRPSVLMYLPKEKHAELDIRFDELNAKYKREHGESLQKNRDYYPAVVEAALSGKDLEDVLDIRDE